MTPGAPLVAVVMGSASDWPTMQRAAAVIERFAVPHEVAVVSAHRMPDEMFAFAEAAATLATGGSPRKIVRGYRRRVRANVRRLKR